MFDLKRDVLKREHPHLSITSLLTYLALPLLNIDHYAYFLKSKFKPLFLLRPPKDFAAEIIPYFLHHLFLPRYWIIPLAVRYLILNS